MTYLPVQYAPKKPRIDNGYSVYRFILDHGVRSPLFNMVDNEGTIGQSLRYFSELLHTNMLNKWLLLDFGEDFYDPSITRNDIDRVWYALDHPDCYTRFGGIYNYCVGKEIDFWQDLFGIKPPKNVVGRSPDNPIMLMED